MISRIKSRLRTRKRNLTWREINAHNGTTCENNFEMESVSIGRYTYGPLTVLNFGKGYRLKIGSFCSIASGVVFDVCGDHFVGHLSTFPFKAKALGGPLTEAISKGDIIIDDDVWIGQNAIILSGVHIGQGAVVGAGAVVTADIPPYAIVGGVPASVIKYRFSKNIIDYLLLLDYSSLTEDLIKEHIDVLYTPIKELELEEIKRLYDWFPLLKNKEMDP